MYYRGFFSSFTPPVFALAPSSSPPDAPTEFTTSQVGQYRIQNLSAVGYLVYVGIGIQPDFTADPFASSPTLPIIAPYPIPQQNQSLYIVPRFCDSYGCISQNCRSFVLTLGQGVSTFGPIPAPQETSSSSWSGGLLVTTQYPSYNIDAHPADTLYVWVSTSAPNTNLTPTFSAPITNSPITAIFGTYPAGTYNVAVAFFRSSDSMLSPIVQLVVVVSPVLSALQAVFTDSVINP